MLCYSSAISHSNIFFSAHGLMEALTAHLGPARVLGDYAAESLRPGVRGHGVFPSFRVRESLGKQAPGKLSLSHFLSN